jgi:hypothetical protein
MLLYTKLRKILNVSNLTPILLTWNLEKLNIKQQKTFIQGTLRSSSVVGFIHPFILVKKRDVLKLVSILMCMGDYRWGLDWQLNLLTTYRS